MSDISINKFAPIQREEGCCIRWTRLTTPETRASMTCEQLGQSVLIRTIGYMHKVDYAKVQTKWYIITRKTRSWLINALKKIHACSYLVVGALSFLTVSAINPLDMTCAQMPPGGYIPMGYHMGDPIWSTPLGTLCTLWGTPYGVPHGVPCGVPTTWGTHGTPHGAPHRVPKWWYHGCPMKSSGFFPGSPAGG